MNERGQQQKKGNGNAKKENKDSITNLKLCLGLPYSFEWPVLDKYHVKLIKEEIRRTFEDLSCDLYLLRKRRKFMEQFSHCSLQEIREKLKENIQKLPNYAGKDVDGILDKLDMAVVQNPLQYTGFGINKLTKHLENSEAVETMDLVIVCGSADPPLMTQHLLLQTSAKKIPSCCINGLSKLMSEILKIKSCLAFYFKKLEDNPFQDLIHFIKDKIPEQHNSKLNEKLLASAMDYTRLEEASKNTGSEIRGQYFQQDNNEVRQNSSTPNNSRELEINLKNIDTNNDQLDKTDKEIKVLKGNRKRKLKLSEPNIQMISIKSMKKDKKKSNKKNVTTKNQNINKKN